MALALEHYQAATQLDPELASAWAGLSATWSQLAAQQQDPSAMLARSRAAADRAFALAPTNTEVLFRNARIYWQLGDEDRANSFYIQAMEHGPDHPLMLSSNAGFALRRGEFEQAINIQTPALLVDPLNATLIHNQSWALLANQQPEPAANLLLRGLAIYPDHQGLTILLARARLLQGKPDEALRLFQALETSLESRLGEALAYQALGQVGPAQQQLDMIRQAGGVASELLLAQFLAMTGKPDEALQIIQRAFASAQLNAPPSIQKPWFNLMYSEWTTTVRELPAWPALSRELSTWLERPASGVENQQDTDAEDQSPE
jgi:tetratricopeptide (TPR) repeat protein